jgi:MOSC domain-containing protein YiiM
MRDDETRGDVIGEAPPDRVAPKMVEAFEHAAGSVARGVAGGATGFRGVLLHIHVAPAASYEMEELAEAECVAGRGIVGDRYFEGAGTYSPKPDTREVTLIEQEALDALARNDPPLQQGAIALAPGDHRRNLTVRGVPLNHLVGRRFRVGEVILRGGRLNFPCKYLEELLGSPVFLPLYNRSGLNCGIERGGVIRPGDAIELLDDAAP